MHAGFSAFQFYKEGTFIGCPEGDIDHGVHFVGFYINTNTGYGHFKVKNSYGTEWGVGGYFYITPTNLCHICEESFFSVWYSYLIVT